MIIKILRYGLAIFLVCSSILVTQAQEKPLTCRVPSGTLTGQEIFARQDWNNNRLTLVSWNTGETVLELETNFTVSAFEMIAWSPQCNYFLAEVNAGEGSQFVAWDTTTGNRVGQINGSARTYRINWSPDNQYVVVQLREGGFLWYLPTNRQTLLNPQVDSVGRSFYSVEWDTDRNQLLVVQIGTGNGVTAYDLSSGQQVGFFNIGDRTVPVSYRRYDNNRYLLVYSTSREHSHDGLPKGVAVWDRDTQKNVQLDPNYQYFILGRLGFDIIGDPSSRYLIISAYSTYFGRLYIWDLQNLIGDSPHVPNYQQSVKQAGDIRLLDANTLEVADWYLWGYVLTPSRLQTTLINLNSYTIQFQSPRGKFAEVCANPSAELSWACEVASNDSYWSDTRSGINTASYWPPRQVSKFGF